MIKNIIIGQNSFVSKVCIKYFKNTVIISANKLLKQLKNIIKY